MKCTKFHRLCCAIALIRLCTDFWIVQPLCINARRLNQLLPFHQQDSLVSSVHRNRVNTSPTSLALVAGAWYAAEDRRERGGSKGHDPTTVRGYRRNTFPESDFATVVCTSGQCWHLWNVYRQDAVLLWSAWNKARRHIKGLRIQATRLPLFLLYHDVQTCILRRTNLTIYLHVWHRRCH